MPENELPADEDLFKGRKLLVIAADESGSLSMEENTFHAWMLSGIAQWLELFAQMEMANELEPEDQEE